MAAPTARIEHGTFTDSPCVQEANMLIESVTFDPKRDQKFWASIVTGCDVIGRDENASCTWKIKGWVTTVGGFVAQAPGTTVSTLANFAATNCTFDPAVGLLLFNDPSHAWAIRELRTLDFTVLHKPYVV